MTLTAVVPLRDGVSGKSRLAAALDPAERRRLVAVLARHVVGTLLATDTVSHVLVVTADVAFTRAVLAGREPAAPGGPGADEPPPLPLLGVEVLPQPADRPGLNGALDAARASALAAGAGRLLVAHADLPDLVVADVEAVLAPLDDRTAVLATDRHGTGTNLLALPAAAPYTFRFGPGSRAAHEAEAATRGLRPVVVRRPGTAADLDTLEDWAELPAAARGRLARHAGR